MSNRLPVRIRLLPIFNFVGEAQFTYKARLAVGILSVALLSFICCYWFICADTSTQGFPRFAELEVNFSSKPLTQHPPKSNIDDLWATYFPEPRPSHYHCEAFLIDNVTAMDVYRKKGRLTLFDINRSRPLPMDCQSIRRRIVGDPNSYTKSLKQPMVIARNVYQHYPVQEALLSMSYHPSSHFCFSLDSKADELFIEAMWRLDYCLPNVYVMNKMFNMTSDGHMYDQAHIACLKHLLAKDISWGHALLLQNDDLVTKTAEELEIISRIFGEAQGIAVEDAFLERYDHKLNWTPIALKLWKNESLKTHAQLHTSLRIAKWYNQVFLSRAFIEAVFEQLDLTSILHRFHTHKSQYGGDEMLFHTLAVNSFLQLPGQIDYNCWVSNPDIVRWTQWNWFKDIGYCKSNRRRHSICLLGVEYLPDIRQLNHIVANKIFGTFDMGAVMCWTEYLQRRRAGEFTYDFSEDVYHKMPQVREQKLKAAGKFNRTTFKC